MIKRSIFRLHRGLALKNLPSVFSGCVGFSLVSAIEQLQVTHLRAQPVLTGLIWRTSSCRGAPRRWTCPSGRLRSLYIFIFCLKVTKESEKNHGISVCLLMSMDLGREVVLRHRIYEISILLKGRNGIS